MAKAGPFIIDGTEYKTDAAGVITETEPARAAVVSNPKVGVLRRMLSAAQVELQAATDESARLQPRIAELTKKVSDLTDLVAGATPAEVIQ